MSLTTLALVGLALAQDADFFDPAVNADSFRPSVSAGRSLSLEDARPIEGVGARLHTGWAHEVLRYQLDDDITSIVAEAVSLYASAYWATPRFRLGASAPLYLLSTGELSGAHAAYMGDPSLDGRVLLRPDVNAPLGVAVLGRLMLPLGASTVQLGQPGLSGELGLGVDYESDRFWLAANVGTRFVPEVDLVVVTLDDQLLAKAGGGVIFAPQCGLTAELNSTLTYSTLGEDPAGQSAEAILTAWGRRDDGLEVRLGVGTGIGSGIGAPRLRVVAGIGFVAPRKAEALVD